MAASKRKTTKKNSESDRSKREVLGICLIALGLFLGASLYSDAVGLWGEMIGKFFFGLFGFMGYGVPVVIVVLGVLVIIFSDSVMKPSAFLLAGLALFSLLSILHVSIRPSIDRIKVFDYYLDAYEYGMVYRSAGGILGALFAYPALLFIGKLGSYILFISCILIAVLLLTRISIKRMGEQIGSGIKHGVDSVATHLEQRRNELYMEDLSTPVRARRAKAKKAKPAKRAAVDPEPPPAFGPYHRHVRPGSTLVKDAEGELEFLPMYGSIERKRPAPAEEPSREALDSTGGDEGTRYVPPLSDAERISRISDRAPRAAEKSPEAGRGAGADKPQQASLGGVSTPQPQVLQYQRPPYTLLNAPDSLRRSDESPNERAKLLEKTLASFGVTASVVNITVGPVITRYELQPAEGVRINRITSLSNDIALALAAPNVIIQAPIPGKAAIGIEIPNKERDTVKVVLREIIESHEFIAAKSAITFALGKDIAGKILFADLNRMPHLLIAGATNSGKSVCMNDAIISLAYKSPPTELRIILIDPKVVEFQMYAPLPHLLLPVVTDPKKAAGALKWAVMEMEQRYVKMAKYNARELSRYNELVDDPEERLPKLVIVIDELADLMMVAAKEVEESICRIAQKGRAAGIHLIVATQRPSTDVITGLIKANIPSRIAFAVASSVDSRVILDSVGAEKLIGRGDMLFHASGANKPIRAQAAFISDEEVERVMDFFAQQQPTEQRLSVSVLDDIALNNMSGDGQGSDGGFEDELLPVAVRTVLDNGQASTSWLQRKLRIGYNRAARLIDMMEDMHIVGEQDVNNKSKARKVLIDWAEYDRIFASAADAPPEDDR